MARSMEGSRKNEMKFPGSLARSGATSMGEGGGMEVAEA